MRFKKIFRENPIIFNFLLGILFIYVKFCYWTIRWEFIWPKNYSKSDLLKEKSVLFAIWHSELAYGIRIFGEYKPIKALASPHGDARILRRLIQLFGYKTIDGSSNKQAASALRSIISDLKLGINIVITPDGPRGPAKQINSSMTKLAHKYGYKLFAVSCQPQNCFKLNSWDKMMIPKPFSKVKVIFSNPISLSGKPSEDDALLAEKLNNPD